MVDTNKLNGLIHAKGYSQRQVAVKIGMNEQRFYRCMKRGVFGSDYIEKLIILLEIDNPIPVFFKNAVT